MQYLRESIKVKLVRKQLKFYRKFKTTNNKSYDYFETGWHLGHMWAKEIATWGFMQNWNRYENSNFFIKKIHKYLSAKQSAIHEDNEVQIITDKPKK